MSAMSPATGTSMTSPVAEAADAPAELLWAAMTDLRSTTQPATHSIRSSNLLLALDIVGEAVHLTGPSGARRVPSAGAIFPYETLVLCRVTDHATPVEWALLKVDSGVPVLLPTTPEQRQRLVAALPVSAGNPGCYVLVMTRPWLSIRKYGARGYVYSQLDAAHAATNILGVALDSTGAVLHTEPASAARDAIEGAALPFHELHSIIELAPVVMAGAPSAATVREYAPALRPAPALDFEARAWVAIVAPLHRTAEVDEPRDAEVETLIDAGADPTLLARWRSLSATRRSAKRFGREPLSGDRLAGVLGALATALPWVSDSPDERWRNPARIAATVLVDSRLDLSPADRTTITGCARLVRYEAGPGQAATMIAACMGQSHIEAAQAFVLLHTDPGPSSGPEIRRVLARAGIAGQVLSLAANGEGIAASTIGGFDSGVWSAAAALPAGTEPVYLLALGAPVTEAGPARNDRAEKASAHGES